MMKQGERSRKKRRGTGMKELKIYAFADEASPEIDGQIRAMERNGLSGLEIRGVDGVNIADISDAKAEEVRKKLDDAGLSVWSIGSPIGKIDVKTGDFRTHLEKFRRTMETAHILGAANIRMFSFYYPEGDDPEIYRNEILERLGLMSEMAKAEEITLCHENEKAIYGDNAERCLDILTHVPGIRGVFDPANFVQVGQDTLSAYKQLAPYIFYMHIKDALPDGRVVPAGKGAGHVKEILSSFREQGGTHVTVEPHLHVFSGLGNLEKEGARSAVGEPAADHEEGWPDSDSAFDAAVAALREMIV